MSAIFGVVSLSGKPVAQKHLMCMDAALVHHGGAGGGLWLDDVVGMGQRLKCFTPQDAFERQPLLSADGSLVLISDGRLDNRAELFTELKDAGCDPSEISDRPLEIPDSALILRAYRIWGQECIRHLVGVFAFAIWDVRTRSLFIARSPIGSPMVLYALQDGMFAFATTPGGLHALPFVPRALHEERLADLLVGMPGSPPEDTLYHHVLRLPTGWCLTVGQDRLEKKCYWQPDLNREIHFAHDEEYLEAFNELFKRVVSDYLRSATPVAVQMSGGLDSASVAAMAARLLADRGKRLTAFTEVPHPGFLRTLTGGRYADETPFVREIAAMQENLDLNLMRTDGQIFFDDIERLFTHLEAPFHNTSNRVWIEAIVREASGRGNRVLLDGIQGNATISWDGRGLLPGLIRSGHWVQAIRQGRALAQNGKVWSVLRTIINQGVQPLLPDPLWIALSRLRDRRPPETRPWSAVSPIHPDFAREQRVPERTKQQNYATQFRPVSDTRRMRFEALSNGDLGIWIYTYRAMYGVDMRSPTADVRLAEFCLALPEDQYLRQGEPRSLIRRAMKSYLPLSVLTNHQRGLQAADWWERLIGAHERVEAELSYIEQCNLARQVLNLKLMRTMLEKMQSVQTNDGAALWDYQFIFQWGLMIGRFLCWFETSGR